MVIFAPAKIMFFEMLPFLAIAPQTPTIAANCFYNSIPNLPPHHIDVYVFIFS